MALEQGRHLRKPLKMWEMLEVLRLERASRLNEGPRGCLTGTLNRRRVGTEASRQNSPRGAWLRIASRDGQLRRQQTALLRSVT